MVKTRDTDEGRLIDQTLLLFQNAIAETGTVVPLAPFGRAADGKDPKAPEKRSASLIGDFVAFARNIVGFETTAAQTELSLQPTADKSAWKELVEIKQFDPLDGQVHSMTSIGQIDGPNLVGAAQANSLNMAEAAASPRKPPGKSTANDDALHLDRPTQERRHTQIDYVHSSRAAKNLKEKRVRDQRSDVRYDRALSIHENLPVDQLDVVKATALPSAEAAAASLWRPVGKLVSLNALPSGRSVQEKIDPGHPLAINAAEDPVGEQRPYPLVGQPSMVEFVPIGESNVDRATPSLSLNSADGAAASIRRAAAEHSTQEEQAVVIRNTRCLAVKQAVSSAQKTVSVNQLLISRPEAIQIGHPSLQPCAKQGPENANAPSDSLVQLALTMIGGNEPNAVGALPPRTVDRPKAVGPLPKPVDAPAARDILQFGRPSRKDMPSLIEHALSVVRDVAISERTTVVVKKVAISEFNCVSAALPSLQLPTDERTLEKPDEVPRSEASVELALPKIAIVSLDEVNVINAVSPPSLSTAGAESLSRRQQIDRSGSEDVLPSLEHLGEEERASIDQSHFAVAERAPASLKTETAVSLSQQTVISQLAPDDRLDVELADIRRRVAAFKEHQERFRREREEYYATTMAKARTPQTRTLGD
jgi:hypothetical protein